MLQEIYHPRKSTLYHILIVRMGHVSRRTSNFLGEKRMIDIDISKIPPKTAKFNALKKYIRIYTKGLGCSDL